MIYQICINCATEKPLTIDYFHFRRDNNKFRPKCRDCHKIKCKKRYDNRTSDQIDQDSKRYMSVPANIRLWKLAKKRADKKGLSFNITPNDIIVPIYCPVFPYLKLNSQYLDVCPSLDRIDNKQGYIVGNIRVISHRANSIKGFASEEELLSVLAYVQGLV